MKATTMKATNMQATKTAKKPSHSSGKSPLDQRLLAYALGGGALALAATPAEAAVIWSGIQNVSVPSLGGGTVTDPTSGGVTNPNSNNTSLIPLFPGNPSSPQFVFGWGGDSDTGDSQIFGATISNSSQQLSGLICTGAPLSFNNFTLGQTFGPTSPAKDWTGWDPNANPKTKGSKSTVFPNYNAIGFFSAYASDNSYDASASGIPADFGTPIPQWAAGATGYAGFVYQPSFGSPTTDAYYGWAQVTVPTTATPGQNATLVQWALESSPNTAIEIGATSSSAVPEIDPASGGSALALLVGGLALVEQQLGFAAGAAGLRAWRKRRQSVSPS